MNKFCILLPFIFSLNALAGPAGNAYFDGKNDKAVKLYNEAYENKPNETDLLNKAFIERENGDFTKAYATLKAAIQKFKTTPVKRSLAETALTIGKHNEAEKLFIEILNSKAGRFSDYIALGNVYFMKGRWQTAEKYYLKALDAEEKAALAYYFLGLCALKQKQTDKAEEMFKKVLNADSQFLEARRQLAQIYEDKAQNEKAWEAYHKLSLAEPENKFLKEKAAHFASLLTRSQDEIIAPYKIASHAKLAAAINGYPQIRIGLSTTISGNPVPIAQAEISPSEDFTVKGKKDSKVYANGKSKTVWSVSISTQTGNLDIKDPSGKIIETKDDTLIFEQNQNPASIILKRLLIAQGTAWAGLSDREYRGTLEISAGKKGLTLVNLLNIEEYVQGVLSAEMPAKFPMEALKAQAVLARTYTMFNLKRHKEHGYDLCDGQHCQVYAGVIAETSRTSQAANATKGMVLTYNGKPVNAVFSSNSGGFTQDGENSWGKTNPYWQVTSDYLNITQIPQDPFVFDMLFKTIPPAYSQKSEYVGLSQYRWTRAVKAADMAQEISYYKDIGDIKAVVPLRRAKSGHIGGLKVIGTKGEVNFDKEFQVRKYLGLGLLRSGAFVMDIIANADGSPDYFIFYGGGWGHGVGFCQSGSSGRAVKGQNYTEILKHYYPNTIFTNLSVSDNLAK